MIGATVADPELQERFEWLLALGEPDGEEARTSARLRATDNGNR